MDENMGIKLKCMTNINILRYGIIDIWLSGGGHLGFNKNYKWNFAHIPKLSSQTPLPYKNTFILFPTLSSHDQISSWLFINVLVNMQLACKVTEYEVKSFMHYQNSTDAPLKFGSG